MEATPKPTKKRLLWFLVGLAGLVLLGLGVMGYLDKSWSNSLRDQDIIVSSQRDSLSGVRKDTTYLVPSKSQ